MIRTGPPAEVLLARLEVELRTAMLALQDGRIEHAIDTINRALDLSAQIRES